MQRDILSNTVAHPFCSVKSSLNTQLPLLSDSVIHHKVSISRRGKMIVSYSRYIGKPYGVSSYWKLLTKGMFHKHYDQVVDCLRYIIALTTCQREAILRLLWIGAYYGNVYPKASQICSEPGCSKATFWRAVMHLKHLGLIRTIPRFRLEEKAQLSDLFILHKLLLLIAKYLAEHIAHIWPDWFDTYIHMTWPQLWQSLMEDQLKLPLPS